jgi:hypothetical protein
MRKTIFKWILVLLTIYGCSKFYYQPPLTKFSHEEHINILFEQQKDCAYCHNLVAIDKLIQQEAEFKKNPELKRSASELKLEGQCHSCHKDQATSVAKAPRKCSTCHEYLKAMKPDNHVNDWKRMHAVPASTDRENCQSCHKNWYCQSCHSQQKTMGSFMHSRTYKLKHSFEAMVDPASCDACHRVDFCIECHLKD